MVRMVQQNVLLIVLVVHMVILILIIVLQYVLMVGMVILILVYKHVKLQIRQHQILHKHVEVIVQNLHIIKMVNVNLNVKLVMLMTN